MLQKRNGTSQSQLVLGYGGPSKVIAIIGPGGTGKSEVAVNLAAGLCKYGQRAVACGDLATATRSGLVYTLANNPGVADFAGKQNLATICRGSLSELSTDYILDNMLPAPIPGEEYEERENEPRSRLVRPHAGRVWWTLFGAPSVSEIPVIKPESVLLMIDRLAEIFDHVILDMSDLIDNVTFAVLARANKIICVLPQEEYRVRQWRDILGTDIVAGSGGKISQNKIMYLLNGVSSRGEIYPSPADIGDILSGFSELGRLPYEPGFLSQLRIASAAASSSSWIRTPWVLLERGDNRLRTEFIPVLEKLLPEISENTDVQSRSSWKNMFRLPGKNN